MIHLHGIFRISNESLNGLYVHRSETQANKPSEIVGQQKSRLDFLLYCCFILFISFSKAALKLLLY